MPRPASRAAARRRGAVRRPRPARRRRPTKARTKARGPARPPSRAERKRPAPERRRRKRAGRSHRRRRPREARGKYVYCVIESEKPLRFGPLGLGAEPSDVHTVHFRDLAAVVSDTPREVIDATRENILAHERVNEAVMRSHTVIPMSFGTVFKTREDIVELLRAAYEAFTDVLQKMQDKLEFGLKVLWDRDQIVREIEKEDENVRRLKDEISSQSGLHLLRAHAVRAHGGHGARGSAERYVREIFEALRPVSTASRANKPIGEKMIMNAAFLVTRDQENAFDAQGQGDRRPATRRSRSSTPGPWPPYNFVNIRLKLERAQGSE